MSNAFNIYSFGLVLLYALGAGHIILKTSPEGRLVNGGAITLPYKTELLLRHFAYFGPTTKELLKLVKTEKSRQLLKQISGKAQ